MMSQIHCKQSIRIEKSGWFKHYFPGNLRRNILFKVCNYTSYQNLQKTSLPNPFAREKAGDKAGTVCAHAAQMRMPCPPLFHGRAHAHALSPAFSRANGLGREVFCRFW